jgi:pyruvate,orthophosphate dikinase
VGELVKLAAERGRKTRPNIKLGICGEHGGDPASIHFCEETGLDYTSWWRCRGEAFPPGGDDRITT